MRYPYHLYVVLTLLCAGCDSDSENRRFSESLILREDATTPVINEVLFDPRQEANDALPDQYEFVEIFNPAITPVDLTGWSITNSRPKRFYFAPSGGNNTLASGRFAVIVFEPNNTTGISSITGIYPSLQGSNDALIFIAAKSTKYNFNNDGDTITLLDQNGVAVDMINYTKYWHNPGNKETKSISIEKTNPLMLSDTALSWTSSNDTSYGATPGKTNSAYIAPVRNEDIFTLSPNPFTPNSDGHNDNLTITISLPSGSYQLEVTVYDATGKLVRQLAAGLPTGAVTRLVWNGRNSSGQTLPTGSYRVTIYAAGYSGSRYSDTRTVTLGR